MTAVPLASFYLLWSSFLEQLICGGRKWWSGDLDLASRSNDGGAFGVVLPLVVIIF
jgi:hypothetical protein